MTTVDEFSFDDFYVSSVKKEKPKKEKEPKNQAVDLYQEENRVKVLEKIQKLSLVPKDSQSHLKQLVNERKILDIAGAFKTGDSCVTIPGKINLRLERFFNLQCDDVKLKVLPQEFYYYSAEAFSFTSQKGHKLRKCKPKDETANSNLTQENLDIFACGSVRILKTFPKAISLEEMVAKNPSKTSKYLKELLDLMHEICASKYTYYNFWQCKQNPHENVIYNNRRWTIINMSRYAHNSSNQSFKNNLRQLTEILKCESELVEILRKNFWNCDDDCKFTNKCYEILGKY